MDRDECFPEPCMRNIATIDRVFCNDEILRPSNRYEDTCERPTNYSERRRNFCTNIFYSSGGKTIDSAII